MGALTIGFDVTSALTGATGIARYVRHLAAALEELDDPPTVRRFAAGRAQVAPSEGEAAAIVRSRLPLRVVSASWAHGGPPSVERLVGPVQTVHAAGPALPSASAPLVAVVHDLAPLDHPGLHPRRNADLLRRYVAGLDRAAAVVVVSQTTADRLAALAPRASIHITPNGRTLLPPPAAPPLAGRRYVLAVGSPVPRKGYDQLLRAVARLHGDDLLLALVGPRGSGDPALARLAAELGLGGRFHRVESASDAELAGWYAQASVLAAPSVDEGFSLPVVEAQGAGVPVVVTDIAVHREVAGGAAAFVPVGDADALAEAIADVLSGGPGVERRRADGRANADRYSWAACAEATLAVHRAVLA
ncbi:MAG: glycosyltransferase family 1 protein [Acidimicrobiales bacterium]|nr:glycosyltransferase family 1 protein [Acidimicrobiales bacterium]